MEIIVGKNAGFCYGVNNAVTKAIELSKKHPDGICCLGELVHNKQVNEELEKNNVTIIDDINKVNNNKVIIRAHGVEKRIYEIAKQKKIELFDYTCPNVLKIHKIIEEYVDKKYYIFLVGINNHPETIGSYSFCGDNSYLIEEIEDIENAISKYKESGLKKALLIVQTTFKKSKFDEIEKILKEQLGENLEVRNTICNATKIRQEETKEISENVDIMIIIGGKTSSNTKKLAEVAKEECNKVYLIETYKDLEICKDELIFFNKFGIMAGASTPKKSIDETVEFLKQLDRSK